MANCTADTVENMVSMMTDLTKTIEELNATIAALQTSIQSLKEDNALLLEENKYLKRKLFGSKSEKISSTDPQQLSLFDEPENECKEELLEEITYSRNKKRFKGEKQLKLEDLEHVKELYDVEEKERVCGVCHSKCIEWVKNLFVLKLYINLLSYMSKISTESAISAEHVEKIIK